LLRLFFGSSSRPPTTTGMPTAETAAIEGATTSGSSAPAH
jgi:hypothetical protein